MERKGLCGIMPAHFLSKPQIIEHDEAVLLCDRIPTLRKTFEVLHLFVVTDVIQQIFIAWEEGEPKAILRIKKTPVTDLESVFLFHYYKIQPGIEGCGRGEGA